MAGRGTAVRVLIHGPDPKRPPAGQYKEMELGVTMIEIVKCTT
jgi:hypothetical protein